jgi:hypothetical protein
MYPKKMNKIEGGRFNRLNQDLIFSLKYFTGRYLYTIDTFLISSSDMNNVLRGLKSKISAKIWHLFTRRQNLDFYNYILE